MKAPARPFPLFPALAAVILLLGMGIRVHWMNQSALWCDEAESSINALTILQTGVPGWKYLGIPVYENTLTQPWEGHPEYEFRDSSYSLKQGVTVYHGWLPLYSIALSQWIFGMNPDHPVDPPRVLHGVEQIDRRTTIPRIPALVYSLAFLIVIARLGWLIGGPVCALAALTLMALNASIVDFGFQARYYSMTLFMTALAAWALWRVAIRGRWRDFLLLGLVSGLLFHTHLFSFFVFSIVSLATAPIIIRHRGWLTKSLTGGGIAVLLVLPWMIFSGFLETADAVPKVFRLFESPWDVLLYALKRPLPLLFLFSVVLLLLGARFMPQWIDGHLGGIGRGIRGHFLVYVLLLFWLAAAYAAFHLIVPAASFFFERLTLVLWVPFALLLGLFVSDLLANVQKNRALIFVVLLMCGLLLIRTRMAFFEETTISRTREGVAALIEALASKEFAPGTRFYATPNDHLTWTYYTGLPVQSVAPVRKEFFQNHPHPVVFIENEMDAFLPSEESVVESLILANMEVTPEAILQVRRVVWVALSSNDLRRRGIKAAPPEGLWENPVFQRLKENTRESFNTYQKKYMVEIQKIPIFRGFPTASIKDVWLGFFYRFVNPEQRLGLNFNLLPRMREAAVEFVPEAQSVVYFSNSPPDPPLESGNSH